MAGVTPRVLPGPAVKIKEEYEDREEESGDNEPSEASVSAADYVSVVYIKEESNIKEEIEDEKNMKQNRSHDSAWIDVEDEGSNEGSERDSPKEGVMAMAFIHKRSLRMEDKNIYTETSKETRGAIIALHNMGLSYNDIAQRTGLSKSTVARWIKRYEATGTTMNQPRSGRPKTDMSGPDICLPVEEKQKQDVAVLPYDHKNPLRTKPRNTSETSKETRGAIIALHFEGLSNGEVARRLGISKSTVATWIKRYKATGDTMDQPRMGRPRCTTSEQDEAIAAAVESNPFSSAVEIQKQLQIPCTSQTIRNRIQAKLLEKCTAVEKQHHNIK